MKQRVSCHTLRHTFVTSFIRNGGDPFALQRLMGHSDIQTTIIYVHLAGTALREAHARASPVDRLFTTTPTAFGAINLFVSVAYMALFWPEHY